MAISTTFSRLAPIPMIITTPLKTTTKTTTTVSGMRRHVIVAVTVMSRGGTWTITLDLASLAS